MSGLNSSSKTPESRLACEAKNIHLLLVFPLGNKIAAGDYHKDDNAGYEDERSGEHDY